MKMRIGLEMGADAQVALDGLFERCQADRHCAGRFPELRRQFEELLSDLEANPRDLEIRNAATGEPEHLRMDDRLFALRLRALLYTPETQRLVPLLIEQATKGNWTGLVGLTGSFNESLVEVMTPALLLAVLCSEDLGGVGAADISARERASFVGTAQIDEFLGYCAGWPKSAHKVDWTPATSEGLPVLLLSGALDPVTPPYRAEEVAATLGNSRHLIVAAGGHMVGDTGCIPDLIAEFIASRNPQDLDASCINDIVTPSFFVSALGPTP
jgi:pimeloyl-ACP methyl ester carboxylesterase